MSSKAPARSVFWFCDLAFCESVLSHSQLYCPHAGLRHVSKSRSWYCHQQGIYQSLLADRKYLSPNKVNISWFWGHMLLLSSDLSAFHCPWLSQNYVMPIWYFCMKEEKVSPMFGISAPITLSPGIFVLNTTGQTCVEALASPNVWQMPTWTFVPLPCLTLSHSSHPGLHLSVCPACDYSNPQILFYPNTKHLPPRDQALTKTWR